MYHSNSAEAEEVLKRSNAAKGQEAYQFGRELGPAKGEEASTPPAHLAARRKYFFTSLDDPPPLTVFSAERATDFGRRKT